MGKAYDDLLGGLYDIVADAVLNEDDRRAEAKERNKKMAELLAEQVDEFLDEYADYRGADEVPEPVHDFAIQETAPVSEEAWDNLRKRPKFHKSSDW